MTDRLLSGLSVLIVEDEMMLLLLIEGMVSDLGCNAISSAASVKQALVAIEANTFAVAILDLNLNGDRSYPIADALSDRKVPFLFATGYGREGVLGEYSDRPVLKKPFRFESLVSALDHLVNPGRFRPAAA